MVLILRDLWAAFDTDLDTLLLAFPIWQAMFSSDICNLIGPIWPCFWVDLALIYKLVDQQPSCIPYRCSIESWKTSCRRSCWALASLLIFVIVNSKCRNHNLKLRAGNQLIQSAASCQRGQLKIRIRLPERPERQERRRRSYKGEFRSGREWLKGVECVWLLHCYGYCGVSCCCYCGVKVQVRHKPCGQTVSCVCAVAVREGNSILAADMCTNGKLHYITYNDVLPDDACIKVSANGAVFEVIEILLMYY